MNFLASPEVVTAMAFSGKLSFNPSKDSLIGADGKPFKFDAPYGSMLPSEGFTPGDLSFQPSPTPTPKPDTPVVISPTSTRLELLQPFESHFTGKNELEFPPLVCLMRVRGKCTTDHISAAGPWLKYKGHLTNISENFLITATNDEGGEVNVAFDHQGPSSPPQKDTIPNIAKGLKARDQPWAIVVDENYGEGSAREHAAMQPRFLGCAMILARSFARIHETNLKKQGILPLWFANKADYDLIESGDTLETVGLANLMDESKAQETPSANAVRVRVTRKNGEVVEIETKHTMSKDQLKWLKAGSALNFIKEARQAAAAA